MTLFQGLWLSKGQCALLLISIKWKKHNMTFTPLLDLDKFHQSIVSLIQRGCQKSVSENPVDRISQTLVCLLQPKSEVQYWLCESGCGLLNIFPLLHLSDHHLCGGGNPSPNHHLPTDQNPHSHRPHPGVKQVSEDVLLFDFFQLNMRLIKVESNVNQWQSNWFDLKVY